jgi:hypothetical protein
MGFAALYPSYKLLEPKGMKYYSYKYRVIMWNQDRATARLFYWPHAAVAGLILLTRDAKRFRIYFPYLARIAP